MGQSHPPNPRDSPLPSRTPPCLRRHADRPGLRPAQRILRKREPPPPAGPLPGQAPPHCADRRPGGFQAHQPAPGPCLCRTGRRTCPHLLRPGQPRGQAASISCPQIRAEGRRRGRPGRPVRPPVPGRGNHHPAGVGRPQLRQEAGASRFPGGAGLCQAAAPSASGRPLHHPLVPPAGTDGGLRGSRRGPGLQRPHPWGPGAPSPSGRGHRPQPGCMFRAPPASLSAGAWATALRPFA